MDVVQVKASRRSPSTEGERHGGAVLTASKGAAEDRRKHISSTLAAETLVAQHIGRATEGVVERVLPDLWLVMIGGSLFDRGREAIVPLVERLLVLKQAHRIAVCVGGGVRARHTYKIGLDLGLPIGGLAAIVGACEEQNALMLWALLARHGGIRLNKEEIELLPLALTMGQTPILVSMPPYHYWEYPVEGAALPLHGSDAGVVLLAENLGCRCVLLKDVDGLHEADPAEHPGARLISRARAADLLAGGPKTLPVDRVVLEILRHSRTLGKVHLTSGLDPDNLGRVLAGEPVGTLLEADHA
jgi:molybdenum storage protein